MLLRRIKTLPKRECETCPLNNPSWVKHLNIPSSPQTTPSSAGKKTYNFRSFTQKIHEQAEAAYKEYAKRGISREQAVVLEEQIWAHEKEMKDKMTIDDVIDDQTMGADNAVAAFHAVLKAHRKNKRQVRIPRAIIFDEMVKRDNKDFASGNVKRPKDQG